MLGLHNLLQPFYPGALFHMPRSRKVLYLTFDDGPEPEVTPQVLEILRKYEAKATFFCIGENVSNHQAVYQQILSEHHMPGNHTWSHIKGWKTDIPTYLQETEKAATLVKSTLFRPPYGRMRPVQFHALKDKYKVVFWDVISWDFEERVSPESCLNNVIGNAREGSIIVLHDSLKAQKRMLYALPRILDHFSSRGYVFNALPAFYQ